MTITKKDIKEQIRKDLGLSTNENDSLEESYVAQPKKYDIKTESLKARTKQAHYELYENYLSALNVASVDLDSSDRLNVNSNYSQFGSTKRAEAFNLNAVHLHELYFANIGDAYSEINVDSLAYMRLARDFGTFDDWQKDFMACAMSCGNGWVVTGLSTYLQRYINVVVDNHNVGLLAGFYPVVVLDMFEHARRDYMNNKMAYIQASMLEFNWNIVEERIKKADAILQIVSK